MLDGVPTPLEIGRATTNLKIDLPGMGENGSLVVENPNNSSVQEKIDGALEWWNNNAYQDGYVNPAGYVAWGGVSYTDANGVRRSASTGNFSLGQVGRIDLPAGAHNITLDVDYRSVFDWFDLFTDKFDVPTPKCYKVWGTLFDRRYSTITCN